MPESLFHVIEHPLFAICLCLLLGAIAVSGKFSQVAANLLLGGVWVVGTLQIIRSISKEPRLMLSGILMLAGFCFIVSHWVRPPQQQAAEKSASGEPTATIPRSLRIKYSSSQAIEVSNIPGDYNEVLNLDNVATLVHFGTANRDSIHLILALSAPVTIEKPKAGEKYDAGDGLHAVFPAADTRGIQI